MQIEQLTADYAQLSAVATLYAQVFAEPPWNEVSKCAQDGFSAEPVGSTCGCGNPRTEAYPLAETAEYIRGELALPGTLATIGIINDIVAFSWGYVGSARDVALAKWKNPTIRRRVTNRIVVTNQLNSVNDSVFYLSEVGVRGDARGQGIATTMVKYALDQTPTDLPWVVRTLASSPMACILDNLGFTKIMGPEPIDQILRQDEERPDRVLYIGRAKPSKLRITE